MVSACYNNGPKVPQPIIPIDDAHSNYKRGPGKNKATNSTENITVLAIGLLIIGSGLLIMGLGVSPSSHFAKATPPPIPNSNPPPTNPIELNNNVTTGNSFTCQEKYVSFFQNNQLKCTSNGVELGYYTHRNSFFEKQGTFYNAEGHIEATSNEKLFSSISLITKNVTVLGSIRTPNLFTSSWDSILRSSYELFLPNGTVFARANKIQKLFSPTNLQIRSSEDQLLASIEKENRFFDYPKYNVVISEPDKIDRMFVHFLISSWIADIKKCRAKKNMNRRNGRKTFIIC